jgi:thermostable 8-oxoguanine DNA glycosylase
MKINPQEITDYNRTTDELEFFLLFCVVVAGKTSHIQAGKLEQWYNARFYQWHSPFDYISSLLSLGLRGSLENVKMGQYGRLVNSFRDVVEIGLDLKKCTLHDLCKIRGIKFKTANFFLTHSRKDYNVPVLDTHVLKFLKSQGVKDVPKATPQDETDYNFFADQFAEIAKEMKMSVADLDLQVWKQYSKAGVA